MKRAIWTIPFEMLGSALLFPEDVAVERVDQTIQDTARRQCQVVLFGDGLPDSCETDSDPMAVNGEYVGQEDGSVCLFFHASENKAKLDRTIRVMHDGQPTAFTVLGVRGHGLLCRIADSGREVVRLVAKKDVAPEDSAKFDGMIEAV